jgi:signal transduction histidine kinase
MNHLVEQLLILAKADHPQQALGAMQPINLPMLIEQVISDLPIEAVESAQWQLTIPSRMTVSGYPTLLHSAIRNLLENALKYGGSEPQVSITVEQHENTIAVTITDQGDGIDNDTLEHLTERFYRAEQHRHYGNGAGLGLSIVARVAQLHGGQLTFENNQPSGLRVTLTIAK